VVDAAITAADEVETLGDKDVVLSDIYVFFERNRRVQNEQKLVATSRRMSQGDNEAESDALLRELSELRSKADLRRPAT